MGPLEFIYYLGYSIKKSYSMNRRKKLPFGVISIGNITLGGTGKTPAVIAVAEEAKKRGFQPCILTRGYKGKAAGPCFVSKGHGALLGPDEAGDEASLMAERLKDVFIVKGGDRYKAGIFALGESAFQPSAFSLQPFLFILDDGFQHWKLHRDRDILLIDSINPFGNNRLLPAGILREPLEEIGRADVIVITKIQRDSLDNGSAGLGLVERIRRYNARARIYLGEHGAVSLERPSEGRLPLETVSGKKIFGFCAIGNPASFRETLLTLGAKVRGFMAFRDHHDYSTKDIRRITKAAANHGAEWIVTTEKDIMKLKDFDLAEKNIVSLRIEFRIDSEFYDEIFRED